MLVAHEVQLALQSGGMDLALCRTNGIRGKKGLSNVAILALLPQTSALFTRLSSPPHGLARAVHPPGWARLQRQTTEPDRRERKGSRRKDEGRPRCSRTTAVGEKTMTNATSQLGSQKEILPYLNFLHSFHPHLSSGQPRPLIHGFEERTMIHELPPGCLPAALPRRRASQISRILK